MVGEKANETTTPKITCFWSIMKEMCETNHYYYNIN